VSEQDDLVAALRPVSQAFQQLGVSFYVGGSVASSFHGASRSTMDVDLVADMTEEAIPQFLNRFGAEFYVSESAIREAIQHKSSFNLIHLPTSFKVDVFISRKRPFDLLVMDRSTVEDLGDAVPLEVPVASVEDIVLIKLEWYRKSNETSERQWDDVTRLLKLLGENADLKYLHEQAAELDVDDLVVRLTQE
jgi:hypothetical protein